jgi:hypothetical protein
MDSCGRTYRLLTTIRCGPAPLQLAGCPSAAATSHHIVLAEDSVAATKSSVSIANVLRQQAHFGAKYTENVATSTFPNSQRFQTPEGEGVSSPWAGPRTSHDTRLGGGGRGASSWSGKALATHEHASSHPLALAACSQSPGVWLINDRHLQHERRGEGGGSTYFFRASDVNAKRWWHYLCRLPTGGQGVPCPGTKSTVVTLLLVPGTYAMSMRVQLAAMARAHRAVSIWLGVCATLLRPSRCSLRSIHVTMLALTQCGAMMMTQCAYFVWR